MATTIAVSPDVAKELKLLKIEEGRASLDEVIEEMLIEYRKKKFMEASQKFRKRMDEKGLKPGDLAE